MKNIILRSKNGFLAALQLTLVLAMVLSAFLPQGTVHAAASLTIAPITWNVVGLDSNLVTVGPNNFPVGVRVCNTGDTLADDVGTTFIWDTTDPYIDLRPGSYDSATGAPYPTVDLAPGACHDFYYEVTVERNDLAYDHTREYHIVADGINTDPVSTETPREIYVEHLISQSRNSTYTVYLDGREIPAGGTMDLMVGNTYEITLVASTATNGYEQIESFINFKNTIFRIDSVTTAYSANDLTSPDPDAGTKLYADGCGWEDNPLSPNYRSCLATGKYGGEVTVVYNVTIIGGAGSSETLSNLIYDFSGSSYHYNADLEISPRIANIYDESSITISKTFAPPNITPGGISRLTLVITNPTDGAISGVNFTDTFPTTPAAMVVADLANAATSGCGTPTFAPIAGAASISFSDGTLAANSSCIIQVDVTAPTASDDTYDNTTGNLFINGTTGTGNTASASLLVSEALLPEMPLTCAVPVLMAFWDMESGVGANGSPIVTSTAPDVATATTSYTTVNGAQTVADPDGKAPIDNAWGGTAPRDTSVPPDGTLDDGWGESATSMLNYFQFVLDTSNYNGVYMVFDSLPDNGGDWADSGNTYAYVNTSTDGVNFTPYTPAPNILKGKWATNVVAIAATTGAGNTTIRLGVDGAFKPAATIFLDDVEFWGCQAPTPLTAPTVTKSFSPDPIAVVDGTSTLTLTITNPDASAASILTGIQINDFLPRETLPGTVTVTNDSTTVTGSGTQFSTTLLPGSIVTIPATAVAITGTLAGTTGSAAITGSGAAFTTDLAVGDTLVINSVNYQVLSITDDTALTLATPYRGANGSGFTGSTYHNYTVDEITDDTHLTLSGNYTGTSGSTTMAAGLTIAGAPSTTCGSPVVGVTGGDALTLTGAPLSGTLAATNGSATVTGTGTAFTTQIGAGRILTLPFQLTGTVEVTTGSFNVTGTGTAFTTQLVVGDMIRIDGEDYYVSAVVDIEEITLATPYRGTSGTGLTAQGYRDYIVQSVSSDTSLTLTTTYSSAAALSGYTATPGLAGAGDTCTVTVPVQANRAGTSVNTTGLITSNESGENTTTSGYGSDTLDAVMPPIISKNFSTNPLVSGGITTLTLTIVNPNPTVVMTGVAFTDDLPAGMSVATPANATNGCGGTWTSTDPLSLSGGTIAAGGTCSVTVDVTASTIGSYVNTTGAVSHTINAATVTGNTATDTLDVEAGTPGLSISKQVGATASGPWYDSTIIAAGANVYYRITVENTGETDLTNVTVKDPPGGATVCTIASLPAPDAADDDHLYYCILGPTTAVAGSVTNTAQADDGTTFSNEDSAAYKNGNFGHLPAAYENMNLYNDGGAMQLNGGTYLGTSVTTTATDGINTATYTPKATDDGIVWTGNWNDGSGYANVTATCPSGTCTLVAWFDWNGDNDFNDENETQTYSVVNGTQQISFAYPSSESTDGDLNAGTYYTRFRIYETTPTDPLPYGASSIIGEIEDPFILSDGGGGTPTPVTVAYFRAQRSGGEVTFEWSTATETGNAGFNLYVEENGGLTRVNPELIASAVIDSLDHQDYTYTAAVDGNVFYIEDVSILNETRLHGPFHLGKPYGELLESEAVDWDALQRQDQALRDRQQQELRAELTVPAAALQAVQNGAGGMQLENSLNLLVDQSGIYRVTYEQLKEAGLDLRNVPLRKITVTHFGESIPVHVVGQAKFGPGAYIEFYGEALDTIYTDTNIYTIQVSRSAADAIQTGNGNPAKSLGTPVTTYTETLEVNRQRARAEYAPDEDTWYDTEMLVYKTARSWNFTFTLDDVVSAPATMEVVAWGVTDWGADPDHHLLVSVNGIPLADELFNGLVEKRLQFSLPAGALHEGANTLTLTLPGDSGVAYELIVLDRYSITYTRSLAAIDGHLTFNADARVLQVRNLPEKNVVVYRMVDGALSRLNQVKVTQAGDGTYIATFAGADGEATYLVTTIANMYRAELRPVRLQADLDQPADYLVIAHPNFIDGIQPLVAARQAQGFTVRVVDVNDIYTQYSYGIFDPQAIKDYIAHAYHDLGTRYVLLVGGDTYDYRDYLGLNSISYIPSLYLATSETARYVPVDPLYADVDGDLIPDLALGRLPVRSTAELEMVVQKTLAYDEKDYGQTAFFVSDRFDGIENFKMISNTLAFSLPEGWEVESAHLDDLSVTAARTQLLAAMNRGTALVTFTGHSGPTMWTFNSLFTNTHAAALTNAGKPFVAVQWGCWNTYIVYPTSATLAQKLLFSGDRGAAAVLGASTLTDSKNEEALGVLLTPRLATPGMTVGDALLLAKQELGHTNADMLDVLLGWTLMGDPALVIVP